MELQQESAVKHIFNIMMTELKLQEMKFFDMKAQITQSLHKAKVH